MQNLFKIALITVLLVEFTFSGKGQENLVPNPSFEDTVSCPDNWAQIDRINNWEAYKGSPDYYNSCEPTNSFSTPQNFMGSQNPISGNAYLGMIFYDKGGEQFNEMVGSGLSQPLSIGTKYYVSFNVVLKYNNSFGICCGQNKIGVKFFNQAYSAANPPAINNSAHVWTDSIINDTLNWTTIFGAFTADSAYSHIAIGNFFDNLEVAIDDIVPSNNSSYYFVDNVCVSTDSAFAANYIYSGVEENSLKDIFKIYPNPVIDYFTIHQVQSDPYNITIYNVIGQKIYEDKNITANYKNINATQFAKGILFITIKSNNQSINYKLLKQ